MGTTSDDAARDGTSSDGRGPKGWTVLLITAAVVAGLAGAGIAIDRWVLDDDGEATPVESAPVTDETAIDVEPVSASPTRLFSRTTVDGVEVRVNESTDDIWGMGMGFGEGDDLPGWCTVASTVSATALSTDAVAQTQLPRTEEPPPKASPMIGVGGIIEAAPLVLMVAQVDDTIASARLSMGGALVDSMEPIDGLVALALSLPGPDPDAPTTTFNPSSSPWGVDLEGVAVEFVHDDGTSQRVSQQQLWNTGLPMWSDPECQQGFTEGPMVPPTMPDLELPDVNAQQPADPAGERALIETTMTRLYDRFSDTDTLFSLVDDASGLDLLMVGLMREWGAAYRAMEVEITDMVFFSPIEASFVYTTGLDVWNDGFSGDTQQFGRARLVDGAWRITRSTVCQDIARSGMMCTI